MIEAVVRGNLLSNPTQRMVPTKKGDLKITEVVMMNAILRKDGDVLVEDTEKSHPVQITFWNEKQGDEIMAVFRSGMHVQASLENAYVSNWVPNDVQAAKGSKPTLDLRGDGVVLALLPRRVESVQMRARKNTGVNADVPATGTHD